MMPSVHMQPPPYSTVSSRQPQPPSSAARSARIPRPPPTFVLRSARSRFSLCHGAACEQQRALLLLRKPRNSDPGTSAMNAVVCDEAILLSLVAAAAASTRANRANPHILNQFANRPNLNAYGLNYIQSIPARARSRRIKSARSSLTLQQKQTDIRTSG